MTPQDYQNPQRFPVTNQDGLTLRQQMQIDAHNLDALREMKEDGRPMDEEQKQIYAELEEKFKMFSAMKEHLKAQFANTSPS